MIKINFETANPVPYYSPDYPKIELGIVAKGTIISEAESTESNRSFITDAAVVHLNDAIRRYSGNVTVGRLPAKISELGKTLSAELEGMLHFKCTVKISALGTDDRSRELLEQAQNDKNPRGFSSRNTPSRSEPQRPDSRQRPNFCTGCGVAITSSSRFCPNCGKAL